MTTPPVAPPDRSEQPLPVQAQPYYYMMAPPNDYAEDEIDLRELWRALLRQKWLIMAIALTATMIAVAVALLMKPVYRVETLLAPAESGQSGGLSSLTGQFGGIAALAGVNLNSSGAGSDKQVALALLTSNAFLEKFLRERALLPVLFADKWDAEHQQWKQPDPAQIPSYWLGLKQFKGDLLSVSEDKKSGLIILAIEWQDRNLAADWASDLVRRVNETMRQRALDEAQASLSYLNQELKKASTVEVRQAIFALIESQTKSMMLANIRDEYAFKVIDPPAIPDEKDRVRPKRGLMVGLGLLGGLMLGVFLALAIEFLRGDESSSAKRLGQEQ